MKINKDKLKLFFFFFELRNYLKINGISGSAVEEHIADWASSESNDASTKKVTMVASETDNSVETK